ALHRLAKDDEALAELERAIEMNKTALDTARASDQVSLLRYQIVDSYVWQANIHRERRDYDKVYQVLAAAVDFDPSRKELLAQEHLASASRYAQSGQTERAIEEYRKAIAAAPDAWQYSYKLGEYLLRSTERWAEALEAFRNAWDKGYQRGIARHGIALALHRLGKDDQALAELERAIEMNRAALDTARASDQAALLRYQIADDYFWHSRIVRSAKTHRQHLHHDSTYRAFAAALQHNPSNNELRGKILGLGHFAFGDGDYDLAINLYRLAFHDPVTGAPRHDLREELLLAWGIAPEVMLELVENRRRLGRIAPEYTHTLLVVCYHGIVVERVGGGRMRVPTRVTEAQKRDVEAKLRWLTQVVESMSDGRFSLSIVKWSDARPDSGQALESPGGYLGDSRILVETINEFDTVMRVWPMSNTVRAWVDVGYLDLRPSRSTSTRRAVLNIGPDHPHGIWLHEFFHILEELAGISPAHGYFPEERRHFPGWTGREEMDYYRWHFRTTLSGVGWKNLNFRLKHPLQ
ncbi:MAG: tetratricopeptide repeat protein, partial [Gemmatimonadetes bacterium]|nr:tetratricopeptide repeat protein [Gemmatimonadota bacterium]